MDMSSDSTRFQDIVDTIHEGTARATGDDFFQELIRFLGELLHVRYAFAARLLPGDVAETLTVSVGGEWSDNFEYALADTPCARVSRSGTCFYPHGVQDTYPKDLLLQDMEVESYIGTALRDASGKPRGLLVLMDVKPMEDVPLLRKVLEVFAARAGAELGRRDAEEALRSSERRYRELLEKTSEGFWRCNREIQTVEVNEALCDMLGYRSEEMIGRLPTDFADDTNSAIIRAQLAKAETSIHRKYEVGLRKKDGSEIHALVSATTVVDDEGSFDGSFALITDISARKRAEEGLRLSESRYPQIFETNQAVKLILDPVDGQIVDANDAAARFYGYSKSELTSMRISDINELPREEVQREMEKADKEERLYFNSRHRLASGEAREVEVYSGPLTISGQRLLYSIVHDITLRKKIEQERERLMMVISQAAETIIITDDAANIQYVNPAFERISGYAVTEVIGRNPRFLKGGAHSEEFYREMWDTLSRGERWEGRLINRHKNGTTYTEEAVISPVRDQSGKIVNFVGVNRDVTGEEELEAQLQQAQKMESVGRLAGGVAHDFNNMLAIILGQTEIALDSAAVPRVVRNSLREISIAAERSADLTRQLLTFARRQAVAPRQLDLNEAISSTLKMLTRLVGEHIRLDWVPANTVWPVRIDPTQLDQVLVNLCVNARDAISGNGHISIETGNVTVKRSDFPAIPDVQDGEFVLLRLEDNGRGMDESTMRMAFEPFFTTKGEGEGRGLGLATVYGIVKQNDGFIDISSTPGSGTVFRIHMPRYGTQTTVVPSERSESAPARGRENILLVEDELGVLKLTKTILERMGYDVLATSSPNEALAMVTELEQPIDLIVTDIIMPEMNGKELVDKILSLSPETKCLYMSGYTADIIAHNGVVGEEIAFIQKPFRGRELAAKVREVLDGP
jgi:two-component system, cell cycle sensor histidine kinase and response regulator CckA